MTQAKSKDSPKPPLTGEEQIFNRDLSWLEFNARVLALAKNPKTPLLERVRFLSIFANNLDEFFMKRAWRLIKQRSIHPPRRGPDGLDTQVRPKMVRKRVVNLVDEVGKTYGTLVPQLEAQGIFFVKWESLSKKERENLGETFRKRIYPILTPLLVDPGHPFPFISNLSVSLGVRLKHPETKESVFARVKIPNTLPQWMLVGTKAKPGQPVRYIRTRDVVQAHMEELFREMIVEEVLAFRVTRNADVDLNPDQRDEDDDLVDLVEEQLRARRVGEVVRLEHEEFDPSTPKGERCQWILGLLREELQMETSEVYSVAGELNTVALGEIADLNFPPLKFKAWTPTVPRRLQGERDLFKVIRDGDLLVHHPYESFSHSVEPFIQAAVKDPKVLAVKITLYRIGDESSLIPLLIEAAQEGKQVVCVVEVKARFDEERNIQLAEQLENAGVHVVYGFVGMKIHSKLTLIVRDEGDEFRAYAHIGTGNYNHKTAKLYTDFGLFTCDPGVTSELLDLFNYLTGLSLKRKYDSFLVAPVNMKDRFLELIEQEAKAAKKGKPSGIFAKMNQLEDRTICRALMRASQAGVPIHLLVRGFCCLRPKVNGVSENITIRSVVGRFLEHSRVFAFRNGGASMEEGLFYMGSADWMVRNLTSRVEAVVPVTSAPHRSRIWSSLQTLWEDPAAWELKASGKYEQVGGKSSHPTCHQDLMDRYSKTNSSPLKERGE